MKKIFILFLAGIFLSGCATYKFDLGKKPPYDKGYVVTRDYRSIVEYTVGKDNTVPEDLKLAKQRFKRRRKTVESYCKQMELIENRFAMMFWSPVVMMGKIFLGVFRLPFIAYYDYKYNHDAAYREKVIRQDEMQESLEKARLKKLQDALNNFIQEDLAKENP